jgi:hypothetical protein
MPAKPAAASASAQGRVRPESGVEWISPVNPKDRARPDVQSASGRARSAAGPSSRESRLAVTSGSGTRVQERKTSRKHPAGSSAR